MKIKPNKMSASLQVELATCLLVFLFLYTGLSKYMKLTSFRAALLTSVLLKPFVGLVVITLPGAEILLVILLIIPVTRLMALRIALVLLLLFTLYICYMLLFAPHLPCNCGGVIRYLTWKQHILFNLFFIAVAFVGIRQQQKVVLYKKSIPNDNKDLLAKAGHTENL